MKPFTSSPALRLGRHQVSMHSTAVDMQFAEKSEIVTHDSIRLQVPLAGLAHERLVRPV